MESEKTFDAQVKAALKDVEVPLNPKAWTAFEQRLNSLGTKPEDALDSLLASRLGSLQVDGKPGDWEAMLQMIEADETTDLIGQEASIDNEAYEKLGNLSAPYRASHWDLMAKRLEEEFSLRHKLYKYKVAEISLMLLLLLTIVRYLPYATDFYQQTLHKAGPVPAEPASPPQNPAGAPGQATPPPQALLQEEPSNTAVADVQEQPPAPAQATGYTNTVNGGKKNRAALNAGTSDTELFDQHHNRATGQELPIISAKTITEIASEIPTAAPTVEKREAVVQASGTSPLADPAPMGRADFLALLDAAYIDTKSAKDFPLLQAKAFEKEKQVRFSLFASTDLNYVFTPTANLDVFDTLVRVNDDTAFAVGYGGGILASFKKNRWEVQTGGVYSFRRYAPNTPKFTIQTLGYYISEDFKGIQQDLLQVPLNLQYHFKNAGNWRFYGMAGASGYFITNVVYEIAFKREPAFSAMAPPDETRTLRDEKEFPQGLFDGGSLSDNFYLTANLGLGVERYISPRWSLFLQPNYHHYFMAEGVGTNKDKFYTLSFYLGTKVSLK